MSAEVSFSRFPGVALLHVLVLRGQTLRASLLPFRHFETAEVDVGANVGWFSLNAQSLGFPVLAVAESARACRYYSS